MSALTRPRGRLPRRVYWTRRVLLVVLLLGMVYGVAHLLQGSTGDDEGQTAATVGAVATAAASSPSVASATGEPSSTPSPSESTTPATQDRSGRGKSPLPAAPEGVCEDSDVVVTPTVEDAHVGQPIRIVLELTTAQSPACTWEVGPDTVVLKVTDRSGDTVWSSQQCPSAVPVAQVVPRKELADKVAVSWSGQGSDSTCSSAPDWAHPGRYHAAAVAIGSVHPVETSFDLQLPVRRTITASPTPTATPTATATAKPSH